MVKPKQKEVETPGVGKAQFPLLPGEIVAHSLGSFHMTNKRLVGYRKSPLNEQIVDYQYKDIKGILETTVHPVFMLSALTALALYVWMNVQYVIMWYISLPLCMLVAASGLLLSQRRIVIYFSDRSSVHLPPAKRKECDMFAHELRKVVYA
jgi:hypothetical protein